MKRSYFKSCAINNDGHLIISGYALYVYYDAELSEDVYMVVDFTFNTFNIEMEIGDDFLGDGFETFDEAHEFTMKAANLKVVN
ncbi:hypothetical protein ACX818_001412 [Acinetobacter baumannii]